MERPLPPPPDQPIITDDVPEVIRNWIIDISRWLDLVPDRVPRFTIYTSTIDPASVAANTTSEQTFTVTGLSTSDIVLAAQKPTHTAGFSVSGARVSAANTLALQFMNVTGSSIDAPSETYSIVVVRN